MLGWLEHTPIWLLGLLLFAAMLVAAFCGYALRQRHKKTSPADPASDAQEGYIVTTAMTLLGLLIGFTFAMVIDRFEARRVMVVDEANAIGTLYLRAQLLEQPHRGRFEDILRRYTDNRIALASTDDGDEMRQELAVNDKLITDLWAATLPAFQSIRGIDFSSAFLDSVNLVIDFDSTRKSARTARIPPPIFHLLFLYAIITAGVVGYVLVGRRGRLTAAALMAMFTMALMLLSDMNRPVSGLIRESQVPMERLRASLRAMPPADTGRTVTAVAVTPPA